MQRGIQHNIHDMIRSGLRYNHNLWDILLGFQGISMNLELSKQDYVTRLYPFMTAAVTNKRTLEDVYNLAILVDPTKKIVSNFSFPPLLDYCFMCLNCMIGN